jgi:V/A-type H+-transporting ATPase subunit I
MANGWVIASKEEELRQRLEKVTRAYELKCSDPGSDDNAPILLANRAMAEPFALITELYGRPQYTEFDPTPFLAPFFVLFFAICLGDAGYGLILAIGSYFALKKFEMETGARRLVKILFAGGLANIVVGLLTGGVFAIAYDELPGVFKAVMLFSPTEQVLLFLYIAFAIGVIQVLFGIGVKMANNIRQGNTTAAILDQGLWLLFLIALVPIVYKGIFGGNVGESVAAFAAGSAKILAVALVLTQGRHVKFILFRPLMGALKLYDAMGYFGDVLSYARLMALGLATAYLGMAFNDMAKMSLGIPYGIGYVVAALLLVFSHIFNLVINCLGAFIHSLRLQYLEFFSKFFIGGGESFEAFAEEREHTVVQSG